MNTETKKQLLEHLLGFVTESRKLKFNEIVKYRTRKLTVVLEDIFQPHNASAVLRSCDCFGIQDVHIIENRNKYTLNPDVELGSSKWLNIHYYNTQENNTPECLETLRKQGYALIATSPHEHSMKLEDLHINKPTAILFGTEKDGLTDYALSNADGFIKIPMFGFSESLNISVSAAICIQHLSSKLRVKTDEWKMSEEETLNTLLDWARNSVNKSEIIERQFLLNNPE